MYSFDFLALQHWFDKNQRPFPWRERRDPYAVWISETMLQQTLASVVVPYFHRWMERFPTIEKLAQAPLEEVIKIWEGLGYYSRARQLHAGAKLLTQLFGGQFPSDPNEWKVIKGIGPYTKGALLSFAFNKKAAAVDGNTLRVLARCFHIEEDIAMPATRKKIWEIAETILPSSRPWTVVEGLIELGATLCTPKNPSCHLCPMQASCRAYANGKTTLLPLKSPKNPAIPLFRLVCVIQYKDAYLVQTHQEQKLMRGLTEFPYIELQKQEPTPILAANFVEEKLGLQVDYLQPLPIVKHTFTKYRATLHPWLCCTNQNKIEKPWDWVTKDKMALHSFSSGHKKIWKAFA